MTFIPYKPTWYHQRVEVYQYLLEHPLEMWEHICLDRKALKKFKTGEMSYIRRHNINCTLAIEGNRVLLFRNRY